MSRATNTKRGRDVKKMIADCILREPAWWRELLAKLGYEGARVKSSTPDYSSKKADVLVVFKTSHSPLWLKVKSFTKSDYSHLARRNLRAFCKDRRISEDDMEFLKGLWLRKARDPRKTLLVPLADQRRVKKIFAPFERDVSAFLDRGDPQIFALCDRTRNQCHFYLMRDVFKEMSGPITFTERGGNIAIGKYIKVQRKGPDKRGESSTVDIDHPSNNVQVKMHVEKFFKDVEPAAVCTKRRDD